MLGLPHTVATRIHASHFPIADTAAIVTIAAVADDAGNKTIHTLDWIHWSYDTAPGSVKTLIVEIDSTVVWKVYIANAVHSPQYIPFIDGLYSVTGNEEMKITLEDGDATTLGSLNVGYH